MDALVLEELSALDKPDHAAAVSHYERVAPLIAAALGRIPITSLFAPEGLDGPVLRVAQLRKALPAHVPTIEGAGASGTHPYLALTADSLLWRVHAYGVGFESWTPSPGDPTRVRFAHVNLTARGGATIGLQRQAARLVREWVNARGLDAFLTLDGPGIMLWIPLDDAPAYPDVRAALHALGRACAQDAPEVFEARPDEPADRIRFSVTSNAVGHGVALPYTLRVAPGLPMNLPIAWSELKTVARDAFDARTSAERLAGGDVLAAEIARIGAQRFRAFEPAATLVRPEVGLLHETPEPRSEVLTVALRLLADGKPRSVDELLAEAIGRDLWPKSERRKYVYATLKAYIEKCVARGQKPQIVEDPDRRFRLNHPADDLPDPRPELPWQAPQDVIDALGATAGGSDPTAFELAVCKAFEALGFCVRHVGGTMNPDGVLDAPGIPRDARVQVRRGTGAAARRLRGGQVPRGVRGRSTV
jgi:DNA primase